jgi:two-component system OmpR family sensor kinase
LKRRWWMVAPLITGILVALLIQYSRLPNPILYLQIDLAALFFILGLVIFLLSAAGIALHSYLAARVFETESEAGEERRRFLGRLNHELKNPLTAILAGLANLSVSETEVDRMASLNSIQNQVSRMRQLVDELRKLSDLETRSLDQEDVDMAELLRVSFALVEDIKGAGERNLRLSIPEAPWPLPKVMGDRDLLILAVHNLLTNAVKFSDPGDTIELRSYEDGNQVVIEVADTGPGIPGNEISQVWEELYRGAGARGIEGSGLGLALVRTIISRHQGKISLRSREGEGSVFTVSLPIAKGTRMEA